MIEVNEKSQCCGCAACVDRCPVNCISLREDEEGFCYPYVDNEVCVSCGLCTRVCPVLNRSIEKRPLCQYAALNPDMSIRSSSSSGGLFSILARYVIDKGGVVFGASFDESWNVHHNMVSTVDDLSALRGSKYVQSDSRNIYLEVERQLKSDKMVLFSGTPCQVAALRLYLGREYPGLLCVDVICHGVPSPRIWRDYLVKLGDLRPVGTQLVGISFRDKVGGWKEYNFTVKFGDGSQLSESHEDNCYMKGFLRDIYLRPSCYDCPAKAGRSGSDITLGDYWGIQDAHPEMDDDMGVSVVLLNSEKGLELFESLDCDKVATSYDAVVRANPSLIYSVNKPFRRDKMFKAILNNGVGTVNRELRKTKRLNSLLKRWNRLTSAIWK